jgi:ribosomal protein L16/L10AE
VVAVIKPGTILYEIAGVNEEIALKALEPRRQQAAVCHKSFEQGEHIMKPFRDYVK